MQKPLILLLLTLLASVNTLLTAAHLWQVKEWRWDRLLEHLRAEPWVRQIFGFTRPAIFLCFVIFVLLGTFGPSIVPAALLAYIVVGALQFLLGRQPAPRFTTKAIALMGVSLGLTTFLAWNFSVSQYPSTPVLQYSIPTLPLLQPFFLILAWLLLYPLDRVLKYRIMRDARIVRSRYATLTVIGITGSVGKTTTKELLIHLLKDRDVLATPGYVNTEIGVAQFLRKSLSSHHKFLVVEMGAYAPGEIASLCRVAQPTVGVITFIGSQHLALFGSLQALCHAKAELLDALPKDGKAFLNADSSKCADLRQRCSCAVMTVGTGGQADVNAESIEETPHGLKFSIGKQEFVIPLHGTHQVGNALLAVSVACEIAGLSLTECSSRLRSFPPLRDTFEVKAMTDGVTILNDTHNASPESFRSAIEWAQGQPASHRILVTSGLIELGEREDAIHEELGALSKPVFQEVYFLSRHCLSPFSRGYGRQVPFVSPGKLHLGRKANTLVVCVGRMPKQSVHTLLSP